MASETVFKAMADATRRRILQLVTRHELSVSELVECLDVPQSTVSRHLKVLRDAGLLRDRREGTAVIYAPLEWSANGAQRPGLEARLFEWLGGQELPEGLAARIDRVLDRRTRRSAEFFARIGRQWDKLRIDAFGGTFHLEALCALLPREWTVADIGSGTGYLLPVLGRTFRRVVAVDPVPEMLDAARARCAEAGLDNVLFREGDLGRLPLGEGDVDLALAVLVLHHVPSPAGALAELFRVVRPGGRLLIVEQQSHRLEEFYERMQDRWWGFEADALAGQVSEAGFAAVRPRVLRPDPLSSGATEGPSLFVLTAEKPGGEQTATAGNETPTRDAADSPQERSRTTTPTPDRGGNAT
ncbi:MAG: metalloregulator ArsR/SmtB family transcription factor [Planctomycetes bacterium]|nr:metalloregulator ArsR/SmtB family transcription factor [Planctomycetota bacterium]